MFRGSIGRRSEMGGVLEHPAYSDAFHAYGLPRPPRRGWQRTMCGGWVCHVEQGRYGHMAKKATWLYAYGVNPPPALRWGSVPDSVRATVSWCHNRSNDDRPRVGKRAAAATPPEFAEVLLSIARSASRKG